MRMLATLGVMCGLGVMWGAGAHVRGRDLSANTAPAAGRPAERGPTERGHAAREPAARGPAEPVAPATAGQAATPTEPNLTDPTRLAQEWDLDGSGTWVLRDGVLALEKPGAPAGKIRRPAALALIKAAPAGDVTLQLELRSTAPLPDKVPRRDLLLIVDYESPTRFYYVHISAARDDVHNGIFVVDNADRRRIDTHSERAPLSDNAWHGVRLERRHATGRIEVYWEGDREPFMVATDTRLKGGRVGVGSFDDSGEFRAIRVTSHAK